MRNLTIGDLKLTLRSLLGPLLQQLLLSQTGKLYEPRLRAKQKAIEEIPDVALTTAPFATELAKTDVRHDGFGAAVYYLAKAIEAHPDLPKELKEKAKTMQTTFVSELAVLRYSYQDEAAAAIDNRAELNQQEADLKTIAVPGGGTAFDWVSGHVTEGDQIDHYLRERAKVLATAENAQVTGPLRASTIGLLGRFRDALRDEIADGTLPAKHEEELFSYIDKLSADREEAVRVSGSGTGDQTSTGQQKGDQTSTGQEKDESQVATGEDK